MSVTIRLSHSSVRKWMCLKKFWKNEESSWPTCNEKITLTKVRRIKCRTLSILFLKKLEHFETNYLIFVHFWSMHMLDQKCPWTVWCYKPMIRCTEAFFEAFSCRSHFYIQTILSELNGFWLETDVFIFKMRGILNLPVKIRLNI